MIQQMHAALATVQLRLATTAAGAVQGAFAAGDTHGVLQAITNYLNLAQHSLFLVDPFSDEVIVEDYLIGMRRKVPVRLLTSNKRDCTARLVAALKRAGPQYGLSVQLRASKETHDRLAFRDDAAECMVMGSSINSAGKRSPTYIAPLDADLAALKRSIYEDIWVRATPVPI